jgi:hypothetical protein
VGLLHELPYLFLALEACIDGMGVVSGKWDTARLEGEVNLRAAFACKRDYITPLYFLL